MFTRSDYEDVQAFFESHPELTPTPLVRLPALAASVGLGDILVKDESSRFGLNAFKIVGVAYAVDRLLRDRTVETLVCATEGNHGRAVARIARVRGLHAIVYIRETAEPARVQAIRQEGADVVPIAGTYDDAVRRMAADASSMKRSVIVSDTSWDGYEAVPRAIMAGYTWIMTEASRQWGPEPPHIVVVQAGVGGLAGAVASWLLATYDASRRPRLFCAEPETAACVRASLAAGRPVALAPGETIMAGLRCGEMSPVAFAPLAAAVRECITVGDDDVRAAMQRLASPMEGDTAVYAGPSGACGLAALLKWAGGPARPEAGAAPGSRALVIVTEGAADPARYARAVRSLSASTTRRGAHR
ncbi:MAG: pyridoxal-phosphate dependent enzyme [Betaproteobacteria bacterium]